MLYDEITAAHARTGEICAGVVPPATAACCRGYSARWRWATAWASHFEGDLIWTCLRLRCYGGFVLECAGESELGREPLGRTAADMVNFTWQGESVSSGRICGAVWEKTGWNSVFPATGRDRCRKAAPAVLLRSGKVLVRQRPIAPAARPTCADSRVPGHQLRIRFRQGVGSRGR